MHVLTCPKALWIGEGGGAWSPVKLSLENSWLPSCCCCSAHGTAFLGSLWCEELLFVKPGPPACSLSTVYLQKGKCMLSTQGESCTLCACFNTWPCWFFMLSEGHCCRLLVRLRLFYLGLLFLAALRAFVETRPLSFDSSRRSRWWGWHTWANRRISEGIHRVSRGLGLFTDNFGTRIIYTLWDVLLCASMEWLSGTGQDIAE